MAILKKMLGVVLVLLIVASLSGCGLFHWPGHGHNHDHGNCSHTHK